MLRLSFSTKRCIYWLDSLVSRWDNDKLQKTLLNSTTVRVLELHLENELMNAILIEHLLVALIHTKFARNLGKTVDHGWDLIQVDRRRLHVGWPIFCKPENVERIFNICDLRAMRIDCSFYSKCLLQSTVISDIFRLGKLAVHIHSNFIHFVPWILIDYALSTITECHNCCIVPPLLQIAIFVVLPTWKQKNACQWCSIVALVAWKNLCRQSHV